MTSPSAVAVNTISSQPSSSVSEDDRRLAQQAGFTVRESDDAPGRWVWNRQCNGKVIEETESLYAFPDHAWEDAINIMTETVVDELDLTFGAWDNLSDEEKVRNVREIFPGGPSLTENEKPARGGLRF